MPSLRPFTHRVYVDFSGDDGDPSKPNSSKVISMAWVLSSVQDIQHNEDLVLKMKKLIGCGPKDEIKYRSIRRHRKKMELLTILTKVKVKLLVLVVLKERVKDAGFRDPRTKRLVDYIHYFPISRFINAKALPPYPEAWFQLVFDEIGWAGCQDAIRRFYDDDKNIIWDADKDPDSLLFGKSGAILMLQLADIFAGMMREYIEGLRERNLPPCHVCHIKEIRDCSYKRKRLTVGWAELMKIVYPLLISRSDGIKIDVGFMIRPPEVQYNYLFIDCLFGARKK
jgi:hypothetical protein